MASSDQSKQMSSKLLTMKFMQRSLAKTSAPSTPNGPPSKRQRLSNGPSTSGTPSDHDRVQAAIAAEELKRTEAVEKQAAAAGETKWHLSFRDPSEATKKPAMRVVQVGFAVIDGDDGEESEEEVSIGRMRFGKLKEREQRTSSDSDSDSNLSEDDDYDSSDPVAVLVRESKQQAADQARQARKAKKKAEREKSLRLAEARRSKEINLNDLRSISGSGLQSSPRKNERKSTSIVCYKCNQPGHIAKDCSQNGGGGPGKKRGRGS